MYHAVYSGTCGSLTQLICNDGDVSTIGGLTIGATYYIRVYTWTSTTGQTSTFNVCVGTPPPPPANDECANATALTVNPNYSCGTVTPGTVSSATTSAQANGCSGTADDDVWFRFVATSTSHRVSLINVAGSTTDMYHAVYSGTCGSLTQLICNDSDVSTLTGLTIGATYYVRVYTYTSTAGQTSTFNVCVGTPPPPPVNDECTNATVAVINTDESCSLLNSGYTTSATESSQANPCSGTDDDDVWYTFSAPNDTLLISLLNIVGTTTDMYFAVYSGNNCNSMTNILCSDANSATLTGLTVGATYRIRVYTYSSGASYEASFNLCIGQPEPPGPGDDCNSAIAFCTGTTYAFPTGVDNGSGPVGPAYGCLCSQPNPVWYYLLIDQAGPLSIPISSDCGDGDYAAWGPFSSLTCAAGDLTAAGNPGCGGNYSAVYGNMVDCAYSSSATEVLDIPAAVVGQYYMVMINNFANCMGIINFSQTGGAGSTDCSIVAPPLTNNGPLCVGDNLQLTVSYPVAGATYSWSGPNGFTSTLMNPFINNVSLANAGVYTLVVTVGGISSAPVTTTVEIYTYPTAGITNNTGSTVLTCLVTPINVTATGGGTYA
jgi:hypothetical protein